MKKLFLMSLVLGLVLSSCRKETSGLPVFALDNTGEIEPELQLPLDSLGWKTSTIALETTDSCLIKNIDLLEESGSYYWIVSGNRISKFDKDGHFLQYVGTVGQGPEEYVSASQIQPVENEQSLYVMDYFGRKMQVYDFNGRFLRSFKLPEESWMNSFRYFDGKIYYQTIGNSRMPDMFCYDEKNGRMDTLSRRDREMGAEGFVGQTSTYVLDNKLYTFHYFNDTIYQVNAGTLVPDKYLQTGKLKYAFEELQMGPDFEPLVKPDGSRMQVFDLFETTGYMFIFYTLSNFEGEKMKSLMALYDKKQSRFYPHVNLTSSTNPWLSVDNGKRLMRTSVSAHLYRVIDASDIRQYKGFETIGEDDNPILIKYDIQ